MLLAFFPASHDFFRRHPCRTAHVCEWVVVLTTAFTQTLTAVSAPTVYFVGGALVDVGHQKLIPVYIVCQCSLKRMILSSTNASSGDRLVLMSTAISSDRRVRSAI